jgi:hypothetical protein
MLLFVPSMLDASGLRPSLFDGRFALSTALRAFSTTPRRDFAGDCIPSGPLPVHPPSCRHPKSEAARPSVEKRSPQGGASKSRASGVEKPRQRRRKASAAGASARRALVS